MSAATLLGLTAMVYFKGYDGFIYTVCFFVGWPIILFLMAERLRNLGKFTFADIASYRLDQSRIRTIAAIRFADRRLLLPDRPDGRCRPVDPAAVRSGIQLRRGRRRHPDDGVRHLRRHDGNDLGADHQGLPAARRRHTADAAGLRPVRLLLREPVHARPSRSHKTGRQADGPGFS